MSPCLIANHCLYSDFAVLLADKLFIKSVLVSINRSQLVKERHWEQGQLDQRGSKIKINLTACIII